jgi:hypothetical protein
VDWSGAAHGAAHRIWMAHVSDGALVTLRNGRSREQLVEDLVSLRFDRPQGLVVGLDFAFSLPRWFLASRGYGTVDQLWSAVAAEGEQWLALCASPFWGRQGKPRPELPEHLRHTERSARTLGIAAKSVFQVGGAGTVGTGSLRGIPHLLRLREAGFSIWPFDPPTPWKVLEIYPRLLTGPVRKRSAAHRAHYIAGVPWSISPGHARAMEQSEDAFDAAVSALVMADRSRELALLAQATDPNELLEGRIWPPPNITV